MDLINVNRRNNKVMLMITTFVLILFTGNIQSVSITNTLVPANNSGIQSKSKVAVLSNGGYVIVFNGETLVGGLTLKTVYARLYDSNGAPLAHEFRVPNNNNLDGTNNYDPEVCSFPGGGFVVSWFFYNGGIKIMSRQFDNAGTPITSDVFLASGVGTTEFALGCLATSYLVIYNTQTGTTSILDLYGVYVKGIGMVNPPYSVSSNGKNHYSPKVGALSSKVVMTWASGSVVSDYDIFFRTFDATTNIISSIFKVNDYTLGLQNYPHALILSSGAFVISWSSQNEVTASSGFDIKAKIYGANNVPIVSEFVVNTSTTGDQKFQYVDRFKTGFIVMWVNLGGSLSINAQKFAADGTKIDSEFTMVSGQTTIMNPHFAAMPSDHFAVTWTGSYIADNQSNHDVLYSHRTFPTCLNLHLYANSGSVLNVNFSSLSEAANLTLKLKTLPTGTLNVISTLSYAVVNTEYALDDIEFTATNISSDSFTYTVIDASANESSTCNVTYTITLCYSSCATCSGNIGTATDHKCTTCASGYAYLHDRTTQCHLSSSAVDYYYFQSGTPDQFLSCMSDCKTCADGSTCSQCAPNYTWDSGSSACVTTCTTGQYYDYDLTSCHSCVTDCDQCTDGSTCEACNVSTYLSPTGLCVGTCPAGTYPDSNVCQACTSPCDTCSNTATECDTCLGGYYMVFNENRCVTQCETGYYLDGSNICQKCPLNCDKCSSDTICTYCSSNYFLDSGLCNTSCISGSWANSSTRTCDSCDSSCDTCSNGVSCDTCPVDTYMNPNSLCASTCPYGYNTNTVSQTCDATACANFCANCSDFIENCPPPPFYYLDTTIIEYKLCYTTCTTCSQAGDSTNHNCDTCNASYYKVSGTSAPMNCYNSTPTGYYFDSTVQEYKACHSTCATCTSTGDATNHKCDTCLSKYYKKTDVSTDCFNTAPLGYYLDISAGVYKQCYHTCKSCPTLGTASATNCFACITGYYPLKDRPSHCVNTTPANYYFDSANLVYVPCYSSCGSCSTTGDATTHNCSTCAIGFFPIKDKPGNCIKNLIPGYFFDTVNNIFTPCYTTCQTCTSEGSQSSNNCLTCRLGFFPIVNNPTQCIADPVAACLLTGTIDETVEKITVTTYSPTTLTNTDDVSLSIKVSEVININNPLTSIYSVELYSRSLISYPMKIDSAACLDLTASRPEGPLPSGEYTLTITDKLGNIIKAKETLMVSDSNLPVTTSTKDLENFKKAMSEFFENLFSQGGYVEPTLAVTKDSFVQYSNTTAQEKADKQAIANRLSLVNFTECELSLKEHYSIPDSETLIYVKLDHKTSETGGNTVDFIIYDQRGNELDLSNCKNEVTYQLPLSQTNPLNLTLGTTYQDKGIDIFNQNDPFYNDICYSYGDGSRDIPINLRRVDIYPNVTVSCGVGCSYGGLDYKTNYSKCYCNSTDAKAVNQDFLEESFNQLEESNLKVVVCYQVLSLTDGLLQNYGFYFTVIVSGFLIGGTLLTTFMHTPVTSDILLDIINNDCITQPDPNEVDKDDNKTENNQEDNNIENLNNNEQQDEVLRIGANPPKEDGEEIGKFDFNNNYKSNNNKFSNNGLISSEREGILSLDGHTKFKFKQSGNKLINENENLIEEDNNVQELQELPVNNVHNIKLEMKNYMNNGMKIPVDSRDITHLNVHDDRTPLSSGKHKNQQIYAQKIDYTFRDYEKMDFKDLLIKDKRNFCNYYWKLVLFNHSVLSVIYKKTLLVPMPIRVYHLIFSILMDFATNAAFYTDSYISERYKLQDQGNFFMNLFFELPRSFYSAFLCCIILFIVSFFLTPKEKAEKELNNHLKTGEMKNIEEAYGDYIRSMKINYICYFVVSILIFAFFCYLIMCFCGVYFLSQFSWLQGGILSFVLRVCVLKILAPLLKAGNRSIALSRESRCLYYHNYPVHFIYLVLA